MSVQNELRILKLKEIQPIVKLSRSSIYRLMDMNKFPKPIKIGDRSIAWRQQDIESWLQTRTGANHD